MELLLNHETVLLSDSNLFESQDMVYISVKDDSDKNLDNNNICSNSNSDQKDKLKQVH